MNKLVLYGKRKHGFVGMVIALVLAGIGEIEVAWVIREGGMESARRTLELLLVWPSLLVAGYSALHLLFPRLQKFEFDGSTIRWRVLPSFRTIQVASITSVKAYPHDERVVLTVASRLGQSLDPDNVYERPITVPYLFGLSAEEMSALIEGGRHATPVKADTDTAVQADASPIL